jgi:hypothetical protein
MSLMSGGGMGGGSMAMNGMGPMSHQMGAGPGMTGMLAAHGNAHGMIPAQTLMQGGM